MTATEQLWFLVGIGGFLLFMEGAITFIAAGIAQMLKLKKPVSERLLKVIAGFVIFIIALVYLFNLPKTP